MGFLFGRKLSDEEKSLLQWLMEEQVKFLNEWDSIWRQAKKARGGAYGDKKLFKDILQRRLPFEKKTAEKYKRAIHKIRTEKTISELSEAEHERINRLYDEYLIRWKHEELGEIKNIKDVYSHMKGLYKLLIKAVKRGKLSEERKDINRYFIFVFQGIKNARQFLLRMRKKEKGELKDFEPVVHHGVLKDKSYFERIFADLATEEKYLLDLLDLSMSSIKNIKQKLSI